MGEAGEHPTTPTTELGLVFTEEAVNELLNKHVFREYGPHASLRRPSREALLILMYKLRVRMSFFAAKPLNESEQIIIRFRNAVKELESALIPAAMFCNFAYGADKNLSSFHQAIDVEPFPKNYPDQKNKDGIQ